MNLPGFTADASAYRSKNPYRLFASASPGSCGGGASSSGTIVAAYFPGPDTQARCSNCLGDCASALADCSAAASAPLLGCLFPPACAAAIAAAAYAQEGCNATSLACQAYCEAFVCCPKPCGIPNPFNPGEGCCDAGEHCVDQNDPNSRNGCCPSDRSVCGNSCCAPGEFCCGNSCCPPGQPCTDGACGVYPPIIPPGTPPPGPAPPPPPGGCPPGTWYNPLFGCAPIIH
jgi:hypothetical protein